MIQSIKQDMERRCSSPVTITDILSACTDSYLLSAIEYRLKISLIKKENDRLMKSNKLKTYCGQVMSNGLMYKAIIAVKTKADIRNFLTLNTQQIKRWKMTDNSVYMTMAKKNPYTFYGCSCDKVGRPSKNDFFRIYSPKPAGVTYGD